jgi:hypothetical protein
MKSIIMPKTVQLDEQTNHQLIQETENIAIEAISIETEIFTASQLWNRQRQMRSASDRIRKWNLR